ncbi:tetratricopeptide repeat protein [Bacillus seohaeanensis]|uniref:Tetratricopeptide repeat protein n=1 Tax=Bacillus seohaeanensis TaxID=284580 RepID=A0ABW5RMA5_9BACI
MSYREQMITALEEGNLEKAKKDYKKVMKSGTDEEKYLLAEDLQHLGFLQETVDLYENLLKKYPGEGDLIVGLSEVFVEMDNEEKAIELLLTLSEQDPEYPRALLLLADLYQMQGLHEVSERKLVQAKQLLPNEEVIDFALAELYMELGRFLEAIRFYNSLLAGGTTEFAGVHIHQRLAEAYSVGGAFEEALKHYEKASSNSLEINTLFGYGFTAYQAGFYETAIEKFISVKELDPEYNSVYLLLAKAYEHEEKLKESFETVQEGISKDEFNKELYLFGGKIALKQALEEDAESLLRQSLALDPGYSEAAFTLNKLFFTNERYSDVLEIINMLKAEGEEDPQIHWDSAKAFEGLEQYNDALNHYRTAYTYFKNHEGFLIEYGEFLIEEGLREEAIEIYKELLRQDPSNVEWQEMIESLRD